MIRNRLFMFFAAVGLAAGCSEPPADDQMRLAQIFKEYQGPGTPGAAVLVIRNGQKVLKGTYGRANLETDETVGANTNFRLASVSKQFTAMSVLMLVDRGELRLNQSLRSLIPEFPAFADSITVAHLLQHTSGLLDYEDFVPADSPTQVTDSGAVAILVEKDSTYFKPGTAFRYSNSGYAVLATIVEKVSDTTYAAFLKENIFEPLEMDGTVAYQKGISTVQNRALGYTVTDSGIVNSDQSPWSAVLGDGGIYSSIDDLYKWDQALYSDTLISYHLLNRAFVPNFENYGFGWRIDSFKGYTRHHHSGSTSGFRNFIMRIPELNFSVIVLTNRAEPSVIPLAEAVAELYAEDVFSPMQQGQIHSSPLGEEGTVVARPETE